MEQTNGIIRDGAIDMPDLATLPPDGGPSYNRLIFSYSPYLLQHARNPVDWYPWCDEAFEKAKREDKPIFLSIGYSTCHWCHVMEHESFVDVELACYLNEHFIAIKVDREERPDVDTIYMTVCQTMTGSGGWPLTIFMTPDKEPFFAGTYFPKDDRFDRPGFLRVLSSVTEAWKNERTKITKIGREICEQILAGNEREASELPASVLGQAVMNFTRSYDTVNGGFGSAPKFPMGHTLSFLLRRYDISKDPGVLHMVEHSLVSMHRGGMYDHVGFGFCRYSTDSAWLVPHFEKMLYDNALLLMVYAEAYQITGKEEYKQVVEEIVAYIFREMTDQYGAFYSAENADSEGEEGKFYVFTRGEFLSLIGETYGEVMAEYFGVEVEGNFEHSTNILHVATDPEEWRKRHNFTADEARSILSETRATLFQYRSRRIHPSRDDKILTSWNGLMIAALARAGQVFSDEAMITAARKAADFLLRTMVTKEGRLLHRYHKGNAGIGGFLEDYAYLIWGLIDLYQATFDVQYLRSAVSLNAQMIRDFKDKQTGGFHFTAHDAEQLLVRTKDGYDGALPSGNSVAAYNLIRLARITGSAALEESAKHTMNAFSHQVKTAPTGFALMLTALDFAIGDSKEILLAGKEVGAVKEMVSFLRSTYLPRAVMLFHSEGEEGKELEALSSYVKDNTTIDGKATAYVCENFVCQRPVTDVKALKRFLRK